MTAASKSPNFIHMMLNCHIEPVYVWGLEPCEGLAPSLHTSVTARGADTRRTPPGRGAASLRSNVADPILLSYGRQFWRERGYLHDKEKASSATAPSSANPMGMAFQSHRLSGTACGVLVSFIRQRMSATSKVALWNLPCLS